MGTVLEVQGTEGDGNTAAFLPFPPHAGSNNVALLQKNGKHLFHGNNVVIEGFLHAEALALFCLGKHRGIVDSSGILVKLAPRLFSKQSLDGGFLLPGKLPDGMDSEILQFFLGSFAKEQKVPNGKRPHFFRDFRWEKGVYLVRFLKV